MHRVGVICGYCNTGMVKTGEEWIGEGEYGDEFKETWVCFADKCDTEVEVITIRGY